jgi:hypothetical protein
MEQICLSTNINVKFVVIISMRCARSKMRIHPYNVSSARACRQKESCLVVSHIQVLEAFQTAAVRGAEAAMAGRVLPAVINVVALVANTFLSVNRVENSAYDILQSS